LQPEDVADAIVWAASRPAHVNIHTVVMTTIDQANSTVFHRHS
jgi:NADP-dependent 3-hydroxy acid dehydrogenase YdfG